MTAVSDLKILSFNLIDWTPLNSRIFALSASEKSPSGPINTAIGLEGSFNSIFLL